MQKWEYEVISGDEFISEVELFKLGERGWELPTAIPVAEKGGGTCMVVYIFKRPKS